MTQPTADLPPARPRSLWAAAWKRFRANRPAFVGAIVLLAELLACGVGLFYALGKVGEPGKEVARYEAQNTSRSVGKSPQKAAPFGTDEDGNLVRPVHLLGSDDLGRDYLARILYGGVISLLIGAAAAFTAAVLGSIYGAISGYIGGRVDNVMMRIVEILYSLPYMLLVILTFYLLDGALVKLAGVVREPRVERIEQRAEALRADGVADARQQAEKENPAGTLESMLTSPGTRSILAMFIAVGMFNWMTEARIVRGQVLQLREMPYIEAARAMGVPARRILFVHMLPNLLGPILVVATLMVPQAILLESFLSFLGVGIQEPQVTWGLLAADAVRTINTEHNHYWLLIPPCAALAVTLLALNFVGDGLRDAFDPQSSR
jgi:ABC-type dipeptide/oligopeptide/nickel transport system permease subunit